MLAVPWVGAALALVYWGLLTHGTVGVQSFSLISALTSLIFLDGIHIIYSFILILALPEMRQWTRSGLWARAGVLALLLGVTFYLMAFADITQDMGWVASVYAMVEVFGPQQHTLAQMRGISFCYHSAIRKSGKLEPSEFARALSVEKWEKVFFRMLLIGDLLFFIPYFLSSGEFQVPDFVYRLHFLGGFMVGAGTVGIFLNGRLFPRQHGSGKMAYLSRVLLFPLKSVVAPALFVLRATHGTEYLIIFRQMVKNSALTESRRKRIFNFTLGASLVYGVVYSLTFPGFIMKYAHFHEPQSVFVSLALLHIVVRYVHYFLDSLIYRMSDPETRGAVAPLLVPARGKQEAGLKAAA